MPAKMCLRPHPKFELALFHVDVRGYRHRVQTWQLRMVADAEAQYPGMKEFHEAMDTYDASLPCSCANCRAAKQKRKRDDSDSVADPD